MSANVPQTEECIGFPLAMPFWLSASCGWKVVLFFMGKKYLQACGGFSKCGNPKFGVCWILRLLSQAVAFDHKTYFKEWDHQKNFTAAWQITTTLQGERDLRCHMPCVPLSRQRHFRHVVKHIFIVAC